MFRKQIGQRHQEKSKRGQEQSDGNFAIPHHDIERRLVFLIMAPESQYKNAERLHEETPDDAKGVRFAEQFDIAAAGYDRGDLQYGNGIDQTVGGSKFPLRPPEPGGQHSVLRQPVQNTVGADDRCVDGAGKNQDSNHDHKDMKRKPDQRRA